MKHDKDKSKRARWHQSKTDSYGDIEADYGFPRVFKCGECGKHTSIYMHDLEFQKYINGDDAS
jgi:hypothetical protein